MSSPSVDSLDSTSDVLGVEPGMPEDGISSAALPNPTTSSSIAPSKSRNSNLQESERQYGPSQSACTVGTVSPPVRRISKSGSNCTATTKSKFFSDPSLNPSARSGSLEGLTKRNGFARQIRILFTSSGPPDQESGKREMLQQAMRSNAMEVVVAMVIFFNFVLLMVETDCSALDSGCAETPSWVTTGMDICYVLFVLELFLRLFAERAAWTNQVWNWVDALIVFTGTLEYVFTVFHVNLSGFSILRILRLFRLLRLMRMLRLFTFLKELRTLLGMMGTCFKTLFWSFMLLSIIMSIWAIIAVEMLNPLVRELAEAGAWKTCSRCRVAFSSVWMANLTFFQTTVAADSWGEIAVPVIEAYPYAAVIFIGAMLMLLFGILNLILAQNREKDISAKSAEMAEEEEIQKRELTKMFLKIDNDASNAISWEELRDGALRVREFRQWLRVMDIDARDLRQLFDIVDEDGSGEIDADEFIDAMYRMRNADAKTASKFSKHLVTKLCEEHKVMREDFEAKLLQLVKVVQMDEACLLEKLHLQEVAVQQAMETAMKRATAVAMDMLNFSGFTRDEQSCSSGLPALPLPTDNEPLPSLFGTQAFPRFVLPPDRFKEISLKCPPVAPDLAKSPEERAPPEVTASSRQPPMMTTSPSISESTPRKGGLATPQSVLTTHTAEASAAAAAAAAAAAVAAGAAAAAAPATGAVALASPTSSFRRSCTDNLSPRTSTRSVTLPPDKEHHAHEFLIEVEPESEQLELSPRTSQRKRRLESIGLTVTNAASLRDPHRDDSPKYGPQANRNSI